jgi:PAS domain-containing protein
MDETGDTIYFKDEESRFVRVSRSKAREVGVTREAIVEMSDFDFMTEAATGGRYENEQRIMASEVPYRDGDERDRVFEHGYTTAQRGTGFGLTIVDDIVSAHGWSIAVTESADGGARFEVDTAGR